ncbi:MAG: outer membrane beta-barrel protein [Saprospiraceae bacterium]
MKLAHFLFLSVSLFATGLSAQVRLGVNVFYNQAWQQYDESLLILRENVYIHTPGASATVEYAIDQHLSLVVEPGFVQRGAACFPGFQLPIGGNEVTFVGNYIEMPVMVQGQLYAWQNRLQFFVQAGAGYSYMISGYREFSFENPEAPAQRNRLIFDEEPNVNRFDFGYYGGGGVGVKAGPGYLTATCRYYHGMPDVDDFQVSKNRALSYALGYRVSL